MNRRDSGVNSPIVSQHLYVVSAVPQGHPGAALTAWVTWITPGKEVVDVELPADLKIETRASMAEIEQGLTKRRLTPEELFVGID